MAHPLKPSALALLLALAFPTVAAAEDAMVACTKAALKQLIILQKLQQVKPLKDKAGRVIATEVIFTGKFMGKKADYRCTQTAATGAVRIEAYSATTGLPAATVAAAQSACTKAAQARNYSVGRIVRTSPVAGGKQALVEMSVFDKAGAKSATCTYDIVSKRTALNVSATVTR